MVFDMKFLSFLRILGISNSHTKSSENESLQTAIQKERLRQAINSFNMSRLSFKISLIAALASSITGLFGGGLLLAGKISEGTLTTGTSAISSTCFYQICKEAQERAEKANKRLEELDSKD